MMGNHKPDAIAKALQAARRARDAEFLRILDDRGDAQAFVRLVDHPYVLPLAELVTNKCTSLIGARVLIENLLATTSEISLEQPLFFGVRVEVLEPTNVSGSELAACLSELCTPQQASVFLEAVGQYRCIDYGYGIVSTAPLLKEKLRQSDGRFLNRAVLVSSGERVFPEHVETLQDQCNEHSLDCIIDLREVGTS